MLDVDPRGRQHPFDFCECRTGGCGLPGRQFRAFGICKLQIVLRLFERPCQLRDAAGRVLLG